MEKFAIDILAGSIVIAIGAAVIAIVKSSLNGFILSLESRFVGQKACDKQHVEDARSREYMRKDIEDHEQRLRQAGA